jgi:hypothetical protein
LIRRQETLALRRASPNLQGCGHRGAAALDLHALDAATRFRRLGKTNGGKAIDRSFRNALLVGAALGGLAGSPPAQGQSSDWPCVQRLVPKLEAGQMWSGPPLEEVRQPSPELQQAARRLVDLKAQPETLAAEVRAFGAQQPEAARARALGQLFWVSLDWLNDERDVVIRGIRRFAVGQQALAGKIVAETRELERLQDASAANPGALDQLQAARLWDTRIYTDRQKSLTLVCDQPVLLEQRAFALARLVQESLP